MKRLLLFAVLLTISTVSFSQDTSTSKNKSNAKHTGYSKSVLGIGNYTEKEIVFEPSVIYNWAFNNIENDAEKEILKKLTESLSPYNMQVKNESVSGNLLLFSVTFSKQLTTAQLKSAADQIKVRVKARDFTIVGSSTNKPVPEIAK
ncbi:MAG: hypothetical protein Q8M29_06810 [Bacteroidota bacterium]|nr:hypothetical protein [Bacteroidota bacterium]